MAGQPLAKVAHPEALDACEGTRAKLTIEVPPSWLGDRLELELSCPKLLTCDRCDGGGCDRCDRSGALRAPAEDGARQVRLVLDGSASPLRVRVSRPFGAHPIDQLIVEVRQGDGPSEGLRRMPNPVVLPSFAARRATTATTGQLALVIAALLVLAVAIAVAMGR